MDEKAMRRLRTKTTARIGVGKAGPRLRTPTLLDLRADHAQAMDSVLFDVDQKLLDELGLFTIKTKCKNRNEFLTRPDLGRKFDQEACEEMKERCSRGAEVQIYAADGLSSRAVEANLPKLLPVMTDALRAGNISVGTPFFVKYGRVATMDSIAELLGCKVICVLIGERPGLSSAESMSAYLAYEPYIGMPEAYRIVVSNIYSGGIPAVEAGAYLSELVMKMLAGEVNTSRESTACSDKT